MTTTTTSTPAHTKNIPVGGKFILSFLGILLYMGLYALLGIVAIFPFEGDDIFVILISIWAPGAFIFYFPWFFWMLKKIWFFKADPVTPWPPEKIREEILSINTYDGPVTVKEKSPTHFIITWKYVDATWWEVFKKAGMTKNYRLHVKLNPSRHEARLIDVETGMNWSAGLTGFHQRFTFFRGIMMKVSVGKAWGIRENFSLGKLYDYHFDPSEIKSPVFNTLLRAGWDVRFAIF